MYIFPLKALPSVRLPGYFLTRSKRDLDGNCGTKRQKQNDIRKWQDMRKNTCVEWWEMRMKKTGTDHERTLSPGCWLSPKSPEEPFQDPNGISKTKDMTLNQKTLRDGNCRLHIQKLVLIFPAPSILSSPQQLSRNVQRFLRVRRTRLRGIPVRTDFIPECTPITPGALTPASPQRQAISLAYQRIFRS